jgi:hypothetical protein
MFVLRRVGSKENTEKIYLHLQWTILFDLMKEWGGKQASTRKTKPRLRTEQLWILLNILAH